jgi:hypothetical protein
MFVYKTEFSLKIAVRNVSYAYSIVLKILKYDNVFYFGVRVSSWSHDVTYVRLGYVTASNILQEYTDKSCPTTVVGEFTELKPTLKA